MKRIISKFSLVMMAVLAVSATSCLKDKGWENGEYGSLNGNTEGGEFVSIPLSSKPGNTVVMGIESKSGTQAIPLFALSYDAKDPAPGPFTATLALNNALVTDPTLTILPASTYTFTTLDVPFRAGRRISDSLILNVNTSTLDPTKKYALGFTLQSVSKAGVMIPSNLKNLIVVFTVKNKYDGIYSFRSQMLHPADRDPNWVRCPYAYPYDIHLITQGPATVNFYNTAFGTGDNHPLMTPAISGFGSTRPQLVFDAATDKITSVTNAFPNPANGRAFTINNGDAGTGNYTYLDPCTGTSKSVTINNRYDAANKKVYVAMIMTQPGFAPMPIFDTLTYIKARP